MSVQYYRAGKLHEILGYLIDGGIDSPDQIDGLLTGMNSTFRATLPSGDDLATHLLRILDELNKTDRLATGEVPLKTFLVNAVFLTKPRPQSTKLQTILDELDAKLASMEEQESSPEPTPESKLPTKPPVLSVDDLDLPELVDKMVASFSMGELEGLCFNLSIDSDSFPGPTKPAKARELVKYCKRRGRLGDLVEELIDQRPNVAWLS